VAFVSACHLIGGTDGLVIDENFPAAAGSGGLFAGGMGGEGGAAGQGAAAGEGGSDACVPAECPGEDTDCRVRECLSTGCGFVNTQTLGMCDDDGGSYCDGAGHCVACIDDELTPCPDAGVCQSFICYAQGCSDNILNNGESAIDCGGPNCGPCANGAACNTFTDCQSYICTGNICTACTMDGDCPGDRYCGATLCQPKRPDWDSCTSDNQCLSGCCTFVPFSDDLCTPC
jgi:hypothetical protein